ncbi:hypothetical protein F444_22721, partial [Phytophthora nicotianae P1976]
FEKGGRDAKEHVQQFLVTCGDDHMAECLYHARVSDIHELEEIIEDMIKGKERMAKRDGMPRHSRSRDSRDTRREESYRRDRRDSDRRRDDYRNQPRVTLAEASLDDLLAELEGREATQGTVELSDEEGDSYVDDTEDYAGYQSDGARSNTSIMTDISLRPMRASDVLQLKARTPAQIIVSHEGTYRIVNEASIKTVEGATEASAKSTVAGATTTTVISIETTDFCKQVHDVGQCELFRIFQDLAKFVRIKGTKEELPPELKAVLAEPSLEADCIYTFRGESEWPDDYVTSVNATVCEKERTPVLGGGVKESVECADADGSISECSFDAVSSAVRDEYKGHSKMMKLNPGERQGWWSAKKFDRRIRMRVLVQGAVNDLRTKVLLDTGANVSVITDTFAKKLRLRDIPDHGRSIDIQGISEGKVSTTRRALVKITLGWEMVYEFEVWVMAHSTGVDEVLGTDFMIPAGIRRDLFHGTAQLPNEVCIPLIKTKNMVDSMEYSAHVNAGPSEALDIPGHESREYRLAKRAAKLEQHVLWFRRTEKVIPSMTRFRRGQPVRIRVTNVSDRTVYVPAFDRLAMLVLVGDLPRGEGYVRLDSKKYKDWQVLAYENCRDRQLFKRECKLYEQWLATQPPSVERRAYLTSAGVMKRSPEDALDASTDHLTCAECWEKVLEQRESDGGRLDSGVTDEDVFEARISRDASEGSSASNGAGSDADEESAGRPQELQDVVKVISASTWVRSVLGARNEESSAVTGETETRKTSTMAGREEVQASQKEMHARASVRMESHVEDRLAEDAITELDKTYISVARVLTTEGSEVAGDPGVGHYEHPANKIGLEDYAKELAFLPDFTEDSNTTIDYGAPNAKNSRLTTDQQERLVATLRKNERIIIASGNALPPPAYVVVCDIDTQGHAPIQQRARRVPLRYLGKLYELLRALLKVGLIVFSESPWASPVVIVTKKNGLDIRLCIDYKMVNVITAIMEYAMPLVDDLLTDLERYLWFCSLDAASGFWAIMMTLRAHKVSAFVCALGHFEWLRMPFGLKNAPMIYQRMIDNALWGFVQPKGGWCKYSELMSTAEEKAKERRTTSIDGSFQTKFTADREASVDTDPVIQLVNDPIADMFQNGEPDESTLVPVFGRRSFVDDICFGGENFDSCLATLDRLLARFAECRISVRFTKSIFCQTK